MIKANFLRICLTRKETDWGIRYLLFQIIFLPTLLNALKWIIPLNTTQLNFLFLLINFVVALILFRSCLVRFLQLDIPSAIRIGWVSLLFWLVYWICTCLLSQVFATVDPSFANQNDQSIIAMTESHYWLMFIGTVFFAPVSEECFHRGLIFRSLYERSAVGAFAVSAIVFSTVHILGYLGSAAPLTLVLSFVQYLPAGLCLAGAYRLSGSLLSPILIHMAINAMGMLALR